MTSSVYLDMLDELFRPGIARLSARFVDVQVRFVAGCQQPDGGFVGRQGRSDGYYTDFALRTLAWLAPEHAAFDRAAGYVARLSWPPRDMVECFNILNARRLLARRAAGAASGLRTVDGSPGGERAAQTTPAFDPLLATQWLYEHLLPRGGFARLTHDERVSAYHTFLGGLCFQMLGVDMPARDDAVRAIEALSRSDGGYAELAGQTGSQTSATAAAGAFLLMHDALPPEQAAGAAQFLARMQSADGGLKAHAGIPGGDLLSTFTGLMTLCGLGEPQLIDTAAVARFLRNSAHPDGGFLSCDADDTPDVEYTHYGVGTLAMLRVLDAIAE